MSNRAPNLLRAAALALAAAAVALAAWRLWQSAVPSGLEVPDLDARRVFTADELRRSANFERFERVEELLSLVVLVAVMALYARRGPGLARESAAGRIGTGLLLGMLGLAIVWLAQVPFELSDLWWQRRHGIAHTGYVETVVDSWLGLGGEFLFICLALVIVMGLARPLRRHWWIAAAPVFVGLALLFTYVNPFLIPDLHRARDRHLVAEAKQLARAEGLPPIPVWVEKVKRDTTAPNAEATGLGGTRRVVLWDTLLDGRFDRREVRIVLAHELGHHRRHHLWKGIAWYALFAFPGAFAIALATRRRGGLFEPAAVPLALLVLVLLDLAATPLQNTISRHMETEADWVALQATRDPQGARGLFRTLSVTSLTAPDPPGWWHLLMDSHPTIDQRLEMAQAWRMRDRGLDAAPRPTILRPK